MTIAALQDAEFDPFAGIEVARREEAPAPADGGSMELMYAPSESVFGAVARDMVALGWSVFPQEPTGNRRPGIVDGEMIKFSEDHQLSTRLPTARALDLWCRQCASLNVAVVLGPATGDAFFVDIDVVEDELSAQVQELADRILGPTPFRRVGRWPKMALVYRHAEGEEVRSRSPKFAKSSPDQPDQGIEIIANGKAMTLHGKHHTTGRYFRWLDASPLTHGPQAAPLVTAAQVDDFMDAVDSVRQFHKASGVESSFTTWEWDASKGINVPKVRSASGASEWVEDENGKVVDGREAYLTVIVARVVTANASAARDASGEGQRILASVVMDLFSATAEMSGRWKGRTLEREIVSKIRHAVRSLESGKLKARDLKRVEETGEYVPSELMHVPAQPRRAGGDSLDFLPPFFEQAGAHAAIPRNPLRIGVREPEPGALEERAISEDRRPIAKAVAEGLLASFNVFFDEVYDPERCTTRVHILKAPTGAGKTSRSIAFIAEDPRTKEPFDIRDESGKVVHSGRSPVLYLLPTYANIEELRHRAKVLNLDPTLSDEDLRAQAASMELIHEDDLPGRVEELRRDAKNAGLVTMLYQGKLRAGCQMSEKVELAMGAGIGTAGFCKAEVPTGQRDENDRPIMEERRCPFYDTCPAISQREQIERSHVVFMPHAFLALSVPDELKNVRCVVADERIHHLFLHTTQFNVDVLCSPRRAVKLSRKEQAEGVDAGELSEERRRAVDIVMTAFMTGKGCPVEALLSDYWRRPEARDNALSLVRSAKRVCSSAIQKDGNINPDMTIEEVREMCAQPTGKGVREEARFWTIVEERLEQRIAETLAQRLGDGKLPEVLRKSRGEREYRIQKVEDVRTVTKFVEGVATEVRETDVSVRLSWRGTPNWLNRPLLLLDASAAPEMIEKIWNGKEVVPHDIPATLNVRIVGVIDRTYSNASVIAPPTATPQERVTSGKLLTKIRRAISLISGAYGWSRTVAGGSILVRRAVNTKWSGPDNVDWCHYGAMRGLDFAKHHAAAISVGRMELPVRTLDGLVAALTYDDPEPEVPFDSLGTGLGIDNHPLRIPMGVQQVRMRSGHDVLVPVPMFPGRWGRMIQRQYREEELLQFLGRLRPVYREGEAPIWFSLTSVIPEEVIVDDLIHLDDVLRAGAPSGRWDCHVWDAMRVAGGVLDADIAATLSEGFYPSRRAAAQEMRALGLDPDTGTAVGRLAWGLVAMSWRGEGRSGHSFVRGDILDPETALRNALANNLGIADVEVEKLSQSRGQTMARGRTPDKIEDELGTLAERWADECRNSDEVALRTLLETPARDFTHQENRRERALPVAITIRFEEDGDEPAEDGRERDNSRRVTLQELEAQASIRALWRRLGRALPEDALAPAAGIDRAHGGSVDLGYAAAMDAGNGLDVQPVYEQGANHVLDDLPVATEYDEYDELIPW